MTLRIEPEAEGTLGGFGRLLRERSIAAEAGEAVPRTDLPRREAQQRRPQPGHGEFFGRQRRFVGHPVFGAALGGLCRARVFVAGREPAQVVGSNRSVHRGQLGDRG
jgi:hypothetical protein